MAYIGKIPATQGKDAGPALKLDDISGDFDGLTKTILEYNNALKNNSSDPFGREHRPLSIEKPPFYSICTHGVSITSTVGLSVDQSLKVITSDKKPIRNLFAAGEILGSGQTMGKCSAGGMMLTPALTFGRLLGQKLLSW